MSEPSQSAAPTGGVVTRPALESIPAYKPGRPPTPREGVTPYKMSSNENPYGPLPSVLKRMEDAVGTVNRYPDMFATALTQKLAAQLGVTPEEVIVSAGSSGILAQAVLALCEPGDEVVYPWRSFEAYPIMVGIPGAKAVPIALDDQGRHDLDALAAAINDKTRMVFVCTPNNPTGPVVTHDELEAFLAKVPSHVLVIVDEAYVEFVTDENAARGMDAYRAHENVMVMRTFSKAYGLAGARVGYGIAHPEVATAIKKTAIPFVVSTHAQEAAIASLEAPGELADRVDAIVAERERMVAALREQGWELPDTQANFVWLGVGERTDEIAAALSTEGLAVRPFSGEGIRISIDVPEANTAVVEALKAHVR